MPLDTEVGFGPGDIVLDGDPLPPPKNEGTGTTGQILAHVCCDQTVGWIKMKNDMEVGLVPGHIVLDGDPCSSPPQKGHTPFFCAHLLWPIGWMD